jgi:hypothetical protein
MTTKEIQLILLKEDYSKLKSFLDDFNYWSVSLSYTAAGHAEVTKKSTAKLLHLSEEIHNTSDRESMNAFIESVPTAERTARIRLRFSFSGLGATGQGILWTSFREYKTGDMLILLNDLRINRYEIWIKGSSNAVDPNKWNFAKKIFTA